MRYEVTTYNFFKVDNCYQYVKGGKLFTFSEEMMMCMVTQYKIAGYMVVIDSDSVLSIAKVNNAAEIFSKKLAFRG